MRIMGIDPSLSCTGWAIIETEDELKLLDCGYVTTNQKKQNMQERIMSIYSGLNAPISVGKPTYVGIETPFTGINPKTTILISYARASAILASSMTTYTMPVVVDVEPRKMKKMITGSGNAQKEDVKLAVMGMVDVADDLPDDVYDAIGIAIATKEIIEKGG